MVEARRRDQLFEPAQPPAQIGVDEEAPEGADDGEEQRPQIARIRSGLGKAQQIDRNEPAQAGEDDIDRMGAGVDEPVQTRRLMVDRMEIPEPRYFVRPAMPPVEAEFADCEDRDQPHPQGKRAHEFIIIGRHDPVGQRHGKGQRYAQHHRGDQPVEEKKAEILQDIFAEDLPRMDGEQPFQRHENGDEQDEPGAEPCHVGQKGHHLLRHWITDSIANDKGRATRTPSSFHS